MPTYYNVTLGANVPHGSDILNHACNVVFTYPGGSHSQPSKSSIWCRRPPASGTMQHRVRPLSR